MFEPQHFMDLHDNSGMGDPKSWLSGDDNSSSILRRTQSSLSFASAAGTAANVDRLLYNDLVEIVPLVQSLIRGKAQWFVDLVERGFWTVKMRNLVVEEDRKASSSFTRVGAVTYTKTPSRESLSRRLTETKGRNTGQSMPTKKRRDHGEKDQSRNCSNDQDGCADSFALFSSRAVASEKDKEELIALRELVEDLRTKIAEKDELLKSAEISKSQMSAVHAKVDELKQQVAEKDSLVKSTQLQLSDAKIKLADKQAALEKMQWEAMTSNRKVEKLQEELESMRADISSFMLLFEGLTTNDPIIHSENYDITPYYIGHLPPIDDLDEIGTQKMEAARKAYVAAVTAAKENQDEESIALAANSRLHLQSFVFKNHVSHTSAAVDVAGAPVGTVAH